jgi:hypothetical protein
MIVWGGTGSAVLGDGARLDSETGQWTALPSAQAPEPRTEHVAVWTGAEMLIWGGGPYPGCYGSDGPAGGRYSLALDAWSPISVIDAPRPDCRETAVWTGGEMMVSGGGAGRYSPTTDSWVSITTPSPWFSEVGSASVWTGAQMAIWGGYGTVAPSETFRDGALLNLGQLADADGDGVSICDGDCDDYDSSRYPAAAELCDGLDNDCDGVVDDVPDGDLDGLDDCADNCTLTYNPEQADGDADLEGDACDLDDGLLLFTGFEAGAQSWQPEVVYDSFNLYRGDLAVLRATGDYTQTLGNADRFCGLAGHAHQDPFEPPEGIVVYYLLTGVAGGVEGTLGTNSAGIERPNASPCP